MTNKRMELAKQRLDSMSGLPDTLLAQGRTDVGDNLTGRVTYVWDFARDRDTKELTLYFQYVDLDGTGHREILPNRVIVAVFNAYARLVKKSRSLSAKERIAKARANGTYQKPFQKGN